MFTTLFEDLVEMKGRYCIGKKILRLMYGEIHHKLEKWTIGNVVTDEVTHNIQHTAVCAWELYINRIRTLHGIPTQEHYNSIILSERIVKCL